MNEKINFILSIFFYRHMKKMHGNQFCQFMQKILTTHENKNNIETQINKCGTKFGTSKCSSQGAGAAVLSTFTGFSWALSLTRLS